MNDYFDYITIYVTIFMVGEFFWFFSLLKQKWIFLLIFISAGLFYIYKHMEWIKTGHDNIHFFWDFSLPYTFKHKNLLYFVKVRDIPYIENPCRKFELGRHKIKDRIFERHIDHYFTTEGYYQTPFKYKWSKTPEGIQVDLIDDTTIVWSLGEGFKETAGIGD